MELFQEMKRAIEEAEPDVAKFYDSGNKRAGTRLRQACQKVRNLALEIRKDVSRIKMESEGSPSAKDPLGPPSGSGGWGVD